MSKSNNSRLGCTVVISLLTTILPICNRQIYAAVMLFVTDTTTGPTDLIHAYNAATGAAIAPSISLLGATGLAIGPSGNLFAVTNNPGFQPDLGSVYQYNSTTHAKIGGPYVTFNGQNDGHDVQGPEGMAFGSTGNIYIADVTTSDVHIYGSSNNSLGVLTSGQLVQPTDVAFDSSGNMYVTSGNADVLRLDFWNRRTHRIRRPVGRRPNQPRVTGLWSGGQLIRAGSDFYTSRSSLRFDGQFRRECDFVHGQLGIILPNQIAFGPDGKLYISGQDGNVGDGEVLRFETDGTLDGPFVTGLENPSFMAFTTVPEPTSIVSFVLGGLGMLLVARRRLQRQ